MYSLKENGKKINWQKEDGFYQMELTMKENSLIISQLMKEDGISKMETFVTESTSKLQQKMKRIQ